MQGYVGCQKVFASWSVFAEPSAILNLVLLGQRIRTTPHKKCFTITVIIAMANAIACVRNT